MSQVGEIEIPKSLDDKIRLIEIIMSKACIDNKTAITHIRSNFYNVYPSEIIPSSVEFEMKR